MQGAINNSDYPLVSVVITCFNLGKYLNDAIDSILNQRYTNWECIIVDDGSTDITQIVSLSFTEKDSRIIYLHKSNEGVSVARNYGIRYSKGEFVLPLDADDKISPDYIDLAVTELKKNPKLKIVYCEADHFGEKSGRWYLPSFSIEEILKGNMIFVSAIFRRSDFDKISGFRNMGFEDWDFWLSIVEISENIEILKLQKVCFYYRIRSDSKFITDGVSYFDNCLSIYNYHKDLYDKYKINPIYQFGNLYTKKSIEYRIGNLIISPVRSLYNFIRGLRRSI